MNRCYFFFLLLLFLGIACSEDEMITDPDNNESNPTDSTAQFVASFNSFGDYPNRTYFIQLTDKDGTNLYDSIAQELDVNIKLDLPLETSVNATVGYLNDNEFNIYTYLDIPTDSELGFNPDWETHPCFKGNQRSKAILAITDLPEYYDIMGSFSPTLEKSYSGDTLVIEGFALNRWKGDNQIAIKRTENEAYKSIVIPGEDWDFNYDTQTMLHTISYNDFTETREYTIDMTYDYIWYHTAMACDPDGNLIGLQEYQAYGDIFTLNDEIKIHVNEAIEINEIQLAISTSLQPRSFRYKIISDTIPDKLEANPDIDPHFVVLKKDEFWLTSTHSYNFNIVQYDYGSNPNKSNWRIISGKGESIKYRFTSLPEELYSEFQYLEELLANPNHVENHLIKTEATVDKITQFNPPLLPGYNTSDLDFFIQKTNRFTLD